MRGPAIVVMLAMLAVAFAATTGVIISEWAQMIKPHVIGMVR